MARLKEHNQILSEAVNNYAVLVDEADSATTYVGLAALGTPTSVAQWQIQKIVVSGTLTQVQWPAGDDAFDQIWDNRASLSYI